MATPYAPTFLEDLHHVVAGRLVHHLAHDLRHLLARRHRHPLQLHLAYLALARAAGSAHRLDALLTDRQIWHRLVETNNLAAREYGTGTLGRYLPPLSADSHRAARARLCDAIDTVAASLTRHAVPIALDVGLLPDTGGSLTRPLPGRTVYGDGTIIRPLYKPGNPTRVDPSAQRHTRHDGTWWGNNLVIAYTRGPGRHRRVILGADRVDRPGDEAATAVDLFTAVHRHTGDRMQAIAYDGAFRGTHHNQLMRDLGVIVVNRVHGAARPRDNRHAPRVVPLTARTHTVDGFDCTHHLVTVDGSVCEATIDAAGRQHVTDPLERVQVRRAHSQTNGYRFTCGIKVPCAREPFTVWIAVHDHADHMRLLPPHEPHFDAIYGLRNDSESNNHSYKTTLTHRRAAGLGWQRQLLDVIGWAILVNSRALAIHGPTSTAPVGRPRHRQRPHAHRAPASSPATRFGPLRARAAAAARAVAAALDTNGRH